MSNRVAFGAAAAVAIVIGVGVASLRDEMKPVTTVYLLVPVAEVTAEVLAASTQTSIETCRYSQDGSTVVLEFYEDRIPSAISEHRTLSHAETRAAMNSEAWRESRRLEELDEVMVRRLRGVEAGKQNIRRVAR